LHQAHADKEQAQFEQEWRELGRVLEQDRKLREKMVGQERGRTTGDEDSALRRSSNKGTWNVAKDKAAQKASLDRVQSFEEAFLQIKGATGIDNIDELVQTFIDAEDQNFSLFNYVNELNNEVEKLEEQIADIKSEIEKYKGQGGQNDRQRKKLLKDLEDRLASTEARAEQYEAKALKAAKTVSQLEQGIQSIFTKIGCDKSAISDMLGTTGVTESNMMQYLGIIEQVCYEIMKFLMLFYFFGTLICLCCLSREQMSCCSAIIHLSPRIKPVIYLNRSLLLVKDRLLQLAARSSTSIRL
jgi:coiled-coil domain-containing protein 63/114